MATKRGSLLPSEPEVSDINISPMIDMVFILLIFFIVTTVFTQEPGVEVNREVALTGRDLPRNSILMAVTPQGEVWYGGDPVGIGAVRGIIRRVADDGESELIIQADRAAPADVVIRVVDEAQIANRALPVHISTQK